MTRQTFNRRRALITPAQRRHGDPASPHSGQRIGGPGEQRTVAESAREVWESACRHTYGPWLACACEFGIHDHTETVPWFQIIGWCGYEFRHCRACPHWQERRADEDPTAPVARATTSGGAR